MAAWSSEDGATQALLCDMVKSVFVALMALYAVCRSLITFKFGVKNILFMFPRRF